MSAPSDAGTSTAVPSTPATGPRSLMSRVSRSQWWALLGIGVLLAAAAVLLRDEPQPTAQAAPDLSALRTAAALEPCPAGPGPATPDVVLPCPGGGADVDLRAFPPGPPLTLLFDAEGRVVHTRSGPFRGLAETEALGAEHLGVTL